MLTSVNAFLNTPIFHYAVPRLAGAALLFIAGSALVINAQVIIGTETSLGQRQIRAIKTGAAIAALYFVWGVPFAASPVTALAYGIFLICSGIGSCQYNLNANSVYQEVTRQILVIPEDIRTQLGLFLGMGYTEIPLPADQGAAPRPETKDFSIMDLGQITGCYADNKQPEFKQCPVRQAVISWINQQPDLDNKTHIVRVDNTNLVVRRLPTTLPKKLPQKVTITANHIAQIQNYHGYYYTDPFMPYIGGQVQTIDDLHNLIKTKTPDKLPALFAAPVWRSLCEEQIHYADAVHNPLNKNIIIKLKTS